jgi:uncharacterized damage-inducible protein DinB
MTMTKLDPLKAHLLEQAHANRWINQEWWKALVNLSLEELDRPQGAFFSSIFGTWNHLLLTDRSWLSRITGRPFAFKKLSDRLCDTKEQFERERALTDAEWIATMEGEADVQRVLVYRNSRGVEFRTPLHQVLQHVFIHQAHHRGQIHQMCDERKIALSDGGLIAFYRR